jgi:recombinational DNA repair protein (RecF pathway)
VRKVVNKMFLKYALSKDSRTNTCDGCGETGGIKYATTERSGSWCEACTRELIRAHLEPRRYNEKAIVQETDDKEERLSKHDACDKNR